MTIDKLTEQQQLALLTGHRLGPYLSYNPVNRAQIWQWCSAMGDHNPCYLSAEELFAPPAMMQMWTMRDINDAYAPGSTDAPPYQVFDDMKALGYPDNVAVSYDISFHRRLREGEQAKHYTTVVNISERKTTALGAGFFVTERVEYLSLEGTLFAEALITYFQYRAAVKKATEVATRKSDDQQRAQSVANSNNWQPDFRDIELSTLSVGDRLPELVIPITHKLIVGGAIATQDFIPVHHNVAAARAAGMPDIFMNILTTSGLSARYLSDWAGAGSCLKALKFRLMAPNLPGDTMVMEGEVMGITPAPDGADVVVSFGGKNNLGYHTKGTAIVGLPGTNTQ